MDYKKIIAQHLIENLGLAIEEEKATNLIEVPKNTKMGDFAFPCFILAKELKKAPQVIAKELAAKEQNLAKELTKVEAAGPYLNFFVNQTNLADNLIPQIISGDFQKKRQPTKQKTMIEYSQPNTHKGFHVGHTRNVSLGDSLVRLRKWLGDEVVAANYIGDVGTHIAKCLWYYKKSGEKYEDYKEQMTCGEFLGMLYAKADREMDFSLLTKCPIPNVVCAEVTEIKEHPKKKDWLVATVSTGKDNIQVITAASNFKTNDKVALAKMGARINGKVVEEQVKDGVKSQGMLCSENELGLGDEQKMILVLDAKTSLGKELADIYQIDKSVDSAYQEIVKREKEVSKVLQDLENEEPETMKLWQKTKEWSMQDFYKIYDWLEAKFDHYFFESEVAEAGKKVVQEYLEKGFFKKDQGAIGIDLSEHKLPFFMVLKSDGTGLYSTKDLALAKRKFEEFQIDRSIYVVDVGQSLHFQQVFKTLELMGYEQAKNCYHLSYGMVMLPEGKMSSRKGNVILLSELQKKLAEQIYNDFMITYEDKWPKEEIDEAIRKISVATIKYGMLNQDSNKNIVFDLKQWAARSGNTGPYMMYAYARTQSILREAKQKFPDTADIKSDWSLLTHESEEKLINRMSQFVDIATKAATRYEPQILCIYLYDLARDFSRMYDHCSVLHAESNTLRATRSQLVEACGLLLKSGLDLIGISTLERM